VASPATAIAVGFEEVLYHAAANVYLTEARR